MSSCGKGAENGANNKATRGAGRTVFKITLPGMIKLPIESGCMWIAACLWDVSMGGGMLFWSGAVVLFDENLRGCFRRVLMVVVVAEEPFQRQRHGVTEESSGERSFQDALVCCMVKVAMWRRGSDVADTVADAGVTRGTRRTTAALAGEVLQIDKSDMTAFAE